MASGASGYSKTPLAKKLSLKDGMRVWFDAMPDSVRAEIDGYGLTFIEEASPTKGLNARAYLHRRTRSSRTAPQ